jgi:heat shock protein HslJ
MRKIGLLGVAFLTAADAACGGGSSSLGDAGASGAAGMSAAGAMGTAGSGGSSSLGDHLMGRSFVSESTTGVTLVAGTTMSVSFELNMTPGGFPVGPVIGASAGCNSYLGPFELRGATLVVTQLGSTGVGCEQPGVMEQEDWLRSFLEGSPTLTLNDPRLVMAGSAATVTLIDRKVAFPDLLLVGTAWKGQGFTDGMVGSAGFGSANVAVTFGSDGHVGIDTSCEKGASAFAVAGATVTFMGLAYDGAACADATFQTTSDSVKGVLDGSPLTFTIHESSLTLTHAGGHALLFTAASADAGAP